MKASHLWLLATSVLAGCAQHSPTATTPDGAATVVPRIAELFSRCELDALVDRYAPTAEFVSPSTAQPLVGREALRHYFAGACHGSFRPLMKVEEQRLRMLAPDAVLITGRYSFGRSDRPADKPWPAFFVITAMAQGQAWLITSQATFAIPEPAAAAK